MVTTQYSLTRATLRALLGIQNYGHNKVQPYQGTPQGLLHQTALPLAYSVCYKPLADCLSPHQPHEKRKQGQQIGWITHQLLYACEQFHTEGAKVPFTHEHHPSKVI
uniref:Uncharacterized protein n=1 Tax=Dunaliella tertiolecta TaxID=3047 RepID=A0A7S3QM67_DUNTE